MKYTIEDLKNGLCAVKNDGTLEELRNVLKKAFSFNGDLALGNCDTYYKANRPHTCIGASYGNPNLLPTQSVKDFLEPEFVWGEEVEGRNADHFDWQKAIFVGINPVGHKELYNYICVSKDGYTASFKQCRKISPILELTLEEVADKFGVKEVKIKQS